MKVVLCMDESLWSPCMYQGGRGTVMDILGISAFYHDSAACVVRDGMILAAAQEERFTRKKQDAGFPGHAIRYCLQEANCALTDLRYIVFYDKPLVKFERLLETYLAFAPRGRRSFVAALPVWLKEKLFLKSLLCKELAALAGVKKSALPPILFTEHHEAHAASAFFPSPFRTAAVLCMDGVGEWATTSAWLGQDNHLTPLWDIPFPHSLGLLYSAFTYYTGFKVNSGEYKVMGLAPYGEPKYVQLIKDKLAEVREDGSLRMNHEYFSYSQGLRMTNSAFDRVFGARARRPESKITQREMDLARSIQVITEEVMLKMTAHVHKETGLKKLCMAGGVALNCVANGRVLREAPFEDVWIQPAAGDAGGAIGIALAIWHRYLGNERVSAENAGTWRSGTGVPAVNDTTDSGATEDHAQDARATGLPPYADGMKGSFLGPRDSVEEIEAFLKSKNLPYQRYSREQLPEVVAGVLADEKI